MRVLLENQGGEKDEGQGLELKIQLVGEHR